MNTPNAPRWPPALGYSFAVAFCVVWAVVSAVRGEALPAAAWAGGAALAVVAGILRARAGRRRTRRPDVNT